MMQWYTDIIILLSLKILKLLTTVFWDPGISDGNPYPIISSESKLASPLCLHNSKYMATTNYENIFPNSNWGKIDDSGA